MIPYELFLRHIRHALPDGRLALANQVFDRMGGSAVPGGNL